MRSAYDALILICVRSLLTQKMRKVCVRRLLSTFLRQEPPDAETYCVRSGLTQILILYCTMTDTLCSYLPDLARSAYDALILICVRSLLTQKMRKVCVRRLLSTFLRQEPPDAETYCVRSGLTQILILYCTMTDTMWTSGHQDIAGHQGPDQQTLN